MWVLLRRSLVAGGNIFEGGNGAPTLSSLPLSPDHCEVKDLLTLLLLCWAAGPKEQSRLTMNGNLRKHEPNKIFFLIS